MTMGRSRAVLFAVLSMIVLTSFGQVKTLKGVWIFQGGIYNGKAEGAPKEYQLQRNYTDKGFTAFAKQKGYKTEKYEAGTYTLKADTCLETATFNSQPSQLTGKTIRYIYSIKAGLLTLSAKLPTGMVVEEHWLLVK